MQPFELARVRPATLLGLGVGCGVVAAVLLFWFLSRALGPVLERLTDRPRVPRPGTTYLVFFLMLMLATLVGGSAIGVNRLFVDHFRLRETTRLGQLSCEPLADGRVRTTFLPDLVAEGKAGGAAETSEHAGPTCRVEAEILTMSTLARRIAGRYLARVVAVGQNLRAQHAGAWWLPEAKHFPVSLVVHGSARMETSAPADPKTRWAVIAVPPDTEGEAPAPAVLGLQRLAP